MSLASAKFPVRAVRNNSPTRADMILAGASMTVEMHQQPGDRACGTEAIGGAHHGPLSVYMSKVADAKTADGSSTWFKVAAIGFNSANGLWADVSSLPPSM